MRYTPKPNKRQVIVIMLMLMTASLVFIGFSLTLDGILSTALKAISPVFCMTGILVTARYLSFTYTYILEDFEFKIVKSNTKIKETVCRLYYTDINCIKPYDKNTKKEAKGKTRYNYCASVYSKELYCIFFECSEEEGVIIFEPDIFFANLLEKRTKSDIIL